MCCTLSTVPGPQEVFSNIINQLLSSEETRWYLEARVIEGIPKADQKLFRMGEWGQAGAGGLPLI